MLKVDKDSVLLISRYLDLAKTLDDYELDVLDEHNTIDLFFMLLRRQEVTFNVNKSKENEEHAAQIVCRIDYLSLAIDLIASLILNDSCSLSDSLKFYSNLQIIENVEQLSQTISRKSDYSYSLMTVWNMSFERLKSDARES